MKEQSEIMKTESLNLKPGFCTALADGVMVPDSPCHMATEEFYRAVPGSRIHLCREGFVFAPAIFSMERDPKYIYTYDYQPEENWSTYSGNLTPDSYQKEDYIFQEDCWFRLCVRREDKEVLTEEDRGQAGELAVLIGEPVAYKEKSCLRDEAEAVIRRIKDRESPGALKLCILTDTHYTVNGNWDDTVYSIRKVAEHAGYDAIVHLGDLTDGMMSKETTSKYVRRIMDDLRTCGVPLYIALGNHDNNYFRNRPNTFTLEEMRELYHLCGDGDDREDGAHIPETDRSFSYYVDMPEHGIRMIFLSSFDDRAPVRYGYTDRQIAWLKKTLYSAPEGTGFLVFSHDGPLARLDIWSFYMFNGDRLLKLLEECNSCNEYQVIGFFYGHTHGDYIFRECSFPVVSIGCSKLECLPPDRMPPGAVAHMREADTRTQELWDSVLIDREGETIHMIRFGAGQDREISFKKKKETFSGRTAAIRAGRKPRIWAHRGASGHAPENTLPAFELAYRQGADGIELDVQLSKDGVPVVIHDEQVDRVSDGTGWVKDYTLEELKTLNVNKHFPSYGRVEIPTLAEVYDLVRKTELTVNLELKNGRIFYKGLEELVLKLAEEKGLKDRILYSSFNHYSIRRLQRLAPGVRTGFLYDERFLDMAEYGARFGVYALHPSVRQVCLDLEEAEAMAGKDGLTEHGDFIRQCHERQILVHVWGVNDEADFEKMKALGADAVITDFVERG